MGIKKLSLIMIFWIVPLFSYSQWDEELLFKIHQAHLRVYISQFSMDSSFYGPKDTSISNLNINCRTRCSEWSFPKIAGIYAADNYNNYIDEYYKNKKIDSLFQSMYNWIKTIEDFATYHNRNSFDFETKARHNSFNINDSYKVIAHKNYIIIYTNFGLRDQEGYMCSRKFRMNKKTISKFKRNLIDYIYSHNMSIKL